MIDLPHGWARIALSGLVSPAGLFSDGDWVESKDQDANGSIRLLQLADLGDGVFLDKSSRFVNEEQFKRLRCTEVLEGDILIARMPDPLGRACLAPRLPQRCITVVDVAILRPGNALVHSAWAMHALNAPQVRTQIDLESSGTTRRRIARGKLALFELPVPPVDEQKRIADKLDAVLARVAACRDQLNRVPAILKRFRQAVLAAAMSGRLTEEWRASGGLSAPVETTLGAVLRVSSGSFLAARDMALGGTIPVFGGNGINGHHDQGNVSKETLVLGRVGYYFGSVHLTPSTAWVTDNAMVVHHDETKTLRRFLYYALQAIDLRANDASTAQPLISGRKLYPLRITIPAMREQSEVVRRVESLFAWADRLEARHAAARTHVERLTPALLAKAFRGELVPQDPADEPASELLERLGRRPTDNPTGLPKRQGAKRSRADAPQTASSA